MSPPNREISTTLIRCVSRMSQEILARQVLLVTPTGKWPRGCPSSRWCDQRRSQPKHLGGQKIWGAKMFDFRRVTLFCLEKRLSKHKMTIFSKNWGVWLLCAPWLRLWLWLHLRLGLALSWCGANRTIRNCWKPWGISSPKVAAPVTTPRRKLGMKIKQWMKVVWRQVSRFQRKPKFLESCMKVSKRSRAYPYDL